MIKTILSTLILFSASFAGLKIDVHREVLPNGMTILVHKNAQAPTVACRLFYTTGSVHEHPGNSGIAHMLEHMLFKGTRLVGIRDSIQDSVYIERLDSLRIHLQAAKDQGDRSKAATLQIEFRKILDEHRKLFIKDELWEVYKKEGGTGLNAFTSDLMTAYIVTLPKNKLELYFWLESDRMQNAVLRDFYAERDVVREERRMRYDDSPSGRYFEALQAMFYEAFPYRIPTIGWPSDIAAFTRAKAEEHYRKYYKPNNAILVLAGDIDTATALPLVRNYFGKIKRGEDFTPVTVREPEQDFEKRLIQRKKEARPRLDMIFHTPGMGHKDLYALDVLEGVLSGRTGRLTRRLVDTEDIALGADAGNMADKYTSAFWIDVNLKEKSREIEVEEIVWNELGKLQDSLITPRELQKVKNRVYASSVRSLENMEHLATRLAYGEMYGDWKIIQTFPEAVSKVTAEEVREVARKYFHRNKVTVGLQLPEVQP